MRASSFVSLIPPGTGGVHDYASVVGVPLHAPLLELTSETDISTLPGDCVLLHFSGYGYQKRGVPLWLAGKIRDLRARSKTVGIVFHELFASGPPWRSAFWLSAWQRRIASELLGLSDFWLSNRSEAARWLLDQGHAVPHRVLPVFSNVGEPSSIDSPRQRTLVVFGGESVRAGVYRWADGEVFRSARRLGVEIHDIGPAPHDSSLSQLLADEGVVVRGKLPPEEVSRALSSASYGALAYRTDHVSKSGVFAAFCAHGVCPILLAKNYDSFDGLVANEHYAAGFDALESPAAAPVAIGRAAHAWYEPHCVKAHAAALTMLNAEART